MILASVSPVGAALSVAAVIAYATPAVAPRRLGPPGMRLALLLSWALHAAALAWSLLGDTPRFGFAPRCFAYGRANISTRSNRFSLYRRPYDGIEKHR